MKKSLICLCVGAILFILTGCITDHVMTTGSGRAITTQGRPKLGKDTGMTSYTDQDGNVREINSSDVAQLIKVN